MASKISLFLGLLSLLAACTPGPSPNDNRDENLIGERLEDLSPMTTREGTDLTSVAIYDSTTGRIDQFDLTSMTLTRSIPANNPSAKHHLLYDQTANYIIDLSVKNLTIYNNSASSSNSNPLHFLGTPQSAAFRASTGHLVIYDDLQSVGLLKIDSQGNVLNAWVGGPIVSGNLSIQSGDITADGKLVVALSDGSITVIDIDQSLAQQKWVTTIGPFASGLTDISWVGAVSSNADQIMVRGSAEIALLSLSGQNTLSSQTIASDQPILKYAKTPDPHILIQTSGTSPIQGGVTMYYAQNSQIQAKSTFSNTVSFQQNILSSRLDLAANTWTYMDSEGGTWSLFNDYNINQSSRMLKRFRFTDLAAIQILPTDDNTQVEVTEQYVFELFPSQFGHAKRASMTDGSATEIKGFNLQYIR
jgi:hypothetical protein